MLRRTETMPKRTEWSRQQSGMSCASRTVSAQVRAQFAGLEDDGGVQVGK